MNRIGICLFFALFISIPIFGQYSAQLLKTDSTKYQLIVTYIQAPDSIILKKQLNYQIFKIRQVDIDNNGQDEFILGVIKKTTFDNTLCKRINIWKVEDNAIVPMWLGSKMPHPLVDFELKKDSSINVVYTIECEKNELYLVAKYKWHSFGLKFMKYIKQEVTLDVAYQTLNNEL